MQSVRSYKKFLTKLENIKNNQTELKNTMTGMKNTLEGMNTRINEAEEWISELGDRLVDITDAEQNKKKKNEKKGGQFKGLLGQH